MVALATADAGCTYVDVWRASIKAVAYGRKEIATAIAAPTPAEQTATPAPTAAAPTTPTATLATMTATPAAAAAANMQHALPDAAIQVVPPDTQRQLPTAAKKRAEQAAKRKREASEAVSEQARAKRAKQLARESPQPTDIGGNEDPAGKGRDNAESVRAAVQPGLKDDDDCLQFIRRKEEYITSDMSKGYKNVVTHATRLTPAERAALLGSLANTIQEDQAKTLRLLEHSVIVSQHFAKRAAE